jgi:hypothetical protein
MGHGFALRRLPEIMKYHIRLTDFCNTSAGFKERQQTCFVRFITHSELVSGLPHWQSTTKLKSPLPWYAVWWNAVKMSSW